MPPTVVYVHGNGNKPAESVLKNSWDAAVRRTGRCAIGDGVLGRPAVPAATARPSAEDLAVLEEGVVQDGVDPVALIAETLAETQVSVLETPGGVPGTEAPPAIDDNLSTWLQEMAYVADGRDLVALDRTIRPEYAPQDRTIDFLVVNDSPNHHGGQQYLASSPVRSAVTALTA